MFILVCIGVCVLLCYAYLLQFLITRYNKIKLIDRIPGPKGYPLIGSVLEFIHVPRNQRLKFIREWHKKYGYLGLFKFWLGPRAVVVLNSPEYVEAILTSTSNIRKASGYVFFEAWLGTGLLTSTGLKWRTRRKMLTPAFHFSILKMYLDTFAENAEILNTKLEKEIESNEFDIFPYINNCTLDIICETAMGVKINAQNETSKYIQAIKEITEILMYRTQRPWLWPDFVYFFSKNRRKQKETLEILHKMSSNIIKQRKEERGRNRRNQSADPDNMNIGIREKKAFLDLLLDISEESDGGHLSDADIREEVDTFMFEGHDTTSSAMMWAIFLLGTYLDIQKKVVQELDLVFGSSNRRPTLNDITELKYLDCVIKESLRLLPAVPFVGRTLDEDLNLGDYLIPSGTIIEINFYMLHRHPEHFADSEKFDPSRFSAENIRNRHPFAFVPFSGGSRNCIGQKFAMLEEKVILSSIFRKYNVTSVEKLDDLKMIPESVLRSEFGMKVKISKRIDFS